MRRNAVNHNAVRVRVETASAGRARSLLQNLPDVLGVDEHVENGVTSLLATPKDGTFVADAVAAVLRAASVDIRSLDVETGRLDDVFHRLTRERAGK